MTNEEAIRILHEESCGNCSWGSSCPNDCDNDECDVNEAVSLAIAALSRDRWISVEERLPVGGDKSGAVCEDIWMLFDDGSVFCGWMNGCTETAYYLDGYHAFVRERPISRVRAWQPKPEPPKEET